MERRSAEARGEGAAAIRAMEQAPVCPAIRAMEQAQQFIAPGWLTTPGPHAVQQPYGSWVPWQSSQPSAAGFVAAFVAKRRKLASYVNGSAADGVATDGDGNGHGQPWKEPPRGTSRNRGQRWPAGCNCSAGLAQDNHLVRSSLYAMSEAEETKKTRQRPKGLG